MSAPERTNGHTQTNGSAFDGTLAPPQNLEAEQSVLGAVLLSDTTLPALIIDERLTPEDFYRESHGRIYQGMLDLNTRSEEHTSELQSQFHLVCRLLLEKKKTS